ncbi:MAG TPA: glutamine--tRNA ligase/YqeY domain fusion protein, partial [Anaeromyxobacteraceae bacterium]|nr:glutamine--tRNA ligase/YqeY domain fusion protein [Anaeromyxobacteraceae bacterium]
PLEDAFEGVTHSICTLEFESNRELYDWVLDHLGPFDPRPHQYEFARLALGYTVLSKRKLLELVNERRVAGWDDPRMPTIAGMRRRGVTPEALRDFAELIGVAKNNSVVDIGKFEYAIRNDLEHRAPRALAVLDPLRLVLTDWPQGRLEELELPWWPGEPARGGSRQVPFGRELLIERDDFALDPPPGYRRLAPGREVRLAGAYRIRCHAVERGPGGELSAVLCSHDPDSRPGEGARAVERGRAAGTLHWVHAGSSRPALVRLYDRLFQEEQPDAAGDFLSVLNPDSLVVAERARVEPALAQAAPGSRYQFLRQGYFFVDPEDSRPGEPVFNRTITLKDTWARASQGAEAAEARRPRERRRAAPQAEEAPRRSRDDARAEARAARPALAQRFERYQAELGMSAEEAALIASDEATSGFFDAAVRAYRAAAPARGGSPRSVARWLVNELLGLSKGELLENLELAAPDFGRLVALVDTGRVTPAAGKVLLASLVERGGDPATRAAELGLERVMDPSAVEAAVARVLEALRAEVERYRGGEKKLFGVLVGAVMRETQGTADAGLVRRLLEERLR